jgi:MYXO-CTERM domain-containing protein
MKLIAITTVCTAAALFLAVPDTAHAGLDACGNIDVSASAECELVTSGGCVAMCEPVAFEAACAGRLYAECEGQCDAEISAECNASCEADCSGQCEVSPPEFDCRASCEADCEGSCSGRCSTGDSQCIASCRGTCTASCDGHCEGTPPEASCDAKCEASCDGRCEAEANVDCQIECQAGGFVDCEAELSGGCEVACERPEGALFCDGQYVDYGNNLEECIAALEAAYDIEVEGYAEGMCSNGTCTGEAGGSVSCAVEPGIGRSAWAMGWIGLSGVVFAVARRRRRR